MSQNSKTSSALTEKNVAVSLFRLSQTLLEDVRLWAQQTTAGPDSDTRLWVRIFTSSPLKPESLRVITLVTLRTTLNEAGGHYWGRYDFLLWLTASSWVQDDRKLPLSFIVFVMSDCFTRERQKNELLSCSGGFITPRLFLLAPRNDVCKCFNFTYIRLHSRNIFFVSPWIYASLRRLLCFLSRCLLFNVQRQYLHTSSQTRECVHKHTWHVSSHYTALVCLTWCSCLHDNTCMQTHST